MNLSNATKIKLIGDAEPRTVDRGVTARAELNGPATRWFAWTEAGVRHTAPESAVVEIF